MTQVERGYNHTVDGHARGSTRTAQTREGQLYEPLDRHRVRCYACGHCCPIPDGALGVCKVRFNKGGRLYVPWGYVGGVQCDPVEKKPFFHAYPGALAYSFGMLGCDLHCSYCQNWVTSQALRDPHAVSLPMGTTPDAVVRDALQQGAQIMVSTYNEPLITSEWAVAIFKAAKAAGLTTGFVSNGNGTPQVLEYLRPWVDLYKVDLKSFDDKQYRRLGGRLDPILDTIGRLYRMGFWLEIVTLLIRGFNDTETELQRLTEFLASVSPDIPWHVTAFHKDYKMTDPADTTAEMLVRAAEIGKQSGLRFVYAGNLPGAVGDLEDTWCPSCGTRLVERHGCHIREYQITPDGSCPTCGTQVPGRWSEQFGGQIAAHPFLPRSRRLAVFGPFVWDQSETLRKVEALLTATGRICITHPLGSRFVADLHQQDPRRTPHLLPDRHHLRELTATLDLKTLGCGPDVGKFAVSKRALSDEAQNGAGRRRFSGVSRRKSVGVQAGF